MSVDKLNETKVRIDEHSGVPTTGHEWDGIEELNLSLIHISGDGKTPASCFLQNQMATGEFSNVSGPSIVQFCRERRAFT